MSYPRFIVSSAGPVIGNNAGGCWAKVRRCIGRLPIYQPYHWCSKRPATGDTLCAAHRKALNLQIQLQRLDQ